MAHTVDTKLQARISFFFLLSIFILILLFGCMANKIDLSVPNQIDSLYFPGITTDTILPHDSLH